MEEGSHTTLVWKQPWIQANHYHFHSAGTPRPWKDGEKAPLNLHWGLSDAEDLLVAQRGVFHCGFCRLKQQKRWIKSTHMLRCDRQPSECGWRVKPDLFKCSELSIHVFFPPGLISGAESEPGRVRVQLKSSTANFQLAEIKFKQVRTVESIKALGEHTPLPIRSFPPITYCRQESC